MKNHTCKFKPVGNLLQCEDPDCKKRVTLKQAALTLTYICAAFGEAALKNKKSIDAIFDELIDGLLRRKAE